MNHDDQDKWRSSTTAPRRNAAACCAKAVLYAGAGLGEIYPLTAVVPKALLPVYDKPLVYYALSVLMLGGVRQVALVTRPEDRDMFAILLADGSQLGIEITYRDDNASAEPAAALERASDFIADDPVVLMLADCLVYGDGLQRVMHEALQNREGATLFAHQAANTSQPGVVALDSAGRPRSIEVGASRSASDLAIMGMFFYDRRAAEITAELARMKGRVTLADVHRYYLSEGRLRVHEFGRGFAWLDTSTPAALNAATNFIETVEATHGLKIGCLEEIAYQRGYITAEKVAEAAADMNNVYGDYLRKLISADSAGKSV